MLQTLLSHCHNPTHIEAQPLNIHSIQRRFDSSSGYKITNENKVPTVGYDDTNNMSMKNNNTSKEIIKGQVTIKVTILAGLVAYLIIRYAECGLPTSYEEAALILSNVKPLFAIWCFSEVFFMLLKILERMDIINRWMLFGFLLILMSLVCGHPVLKALFIFLILKRGMIPFAICMYKYYKYKSIAHAIESVPEQFQGIPFKLFKMAMRATGRIHRMVAAIASTTRS